MAVVLPRRGAAGARGIVLGGPDEAAKGVVFCQVPVRERGARHRRGVVHLQPLLDGHALIGVAVSSEDRLGHSLMRDRAHEVRLNLESQGLFGLRFRDLQQDLILLGLCCRGLHSHVLMELIQVGELQRQALLRRELLPMQRRALTARRSVVIVGIEYHRKRMLGILKPPLGLLQLLPKLFDSPLCVRNTELALTLHNSARLRAFRSLLLPKGLRVPLVLAELCLSRIELVLCREVLPFERGQLLSQLQGGSDLGAASL
mmetsp:Transcript_113659/g.253655  ORF Transcript_113659/g.253655 Transcript_113659/m.253655 type:complete len:259 (+) Transcript_113659:215-991(+)